MGHPMRIELTRAGLLVYLANHYTTRGALHHPRCPRINTSVCLIQSDTHAPLPHIYIYVTNIVFNWNHFEMRLLNLRINFYLLQTFCPHLGSFFFFFFFFFCFFFHYKYVQDRPAYEVVVSDWIVRFSMFQIHSSFRRSHSSKLIDLPSSAPNLCCLFWALWGCFGRHPYIYTYIYITHRKKITYSYRAIMNSIYEYSKLIVTGHKPDITAIYMYIYGCCQKQPCFLTVTTCHQYLSVTVFFILWWDVTEMKGSFFRILKYR